MSRDEGWFEAAFEAIAGAPNGVARLRELILGLAVQGRLIPQKMKDEPASELLNRIAEEKARLIGAGKLRKSPPLAPVEESEKPFEIPDSWEWVRLGDVRYSLGQKTPDTDFSYIDVSSINKEKGIISNDVAIVKAENAPSRARKLVTQGTVIYSTVRPNLLNIAIVDREFDPEPIVSTAFAIIHPFEGVSSRFLYLFLRSRTFIDFVESKMIGVAYPAINDDNLFKGVVPLPPLAEQERIVARVDELMALCDELDARQTRLALGRGAALKATLNALCAPRTGEAFDATLARLMSDFDALFDAPASVAPLRAAILSLAVQGRLIPQKMEDEPASALWNRIQNHKAELVAQKKLRPSPPLAPIEESETPFPIPASWVWARLGEVTEKLGAGSTPLGGKEIYQSEGIKFLRSQNVWNSGLSLHNVAYISEEIHQKMRGTSVDAGDILLNITGASIGRSAIFPKDVEEANVSQHVAIVRLIDKSINSFIHLCIISPYFQAEIMGVQVGISREGLSMASLKEFSIPLPPLAEQKRIVARVDELMALCDGLETQLRSREAAARDLADAAVQFLSRSATASAL